MRPTRRFSEARCRGGAGLGASAGPTRKDFPPQVVHGSPLDPGRARRPAPGTQDSSRPDAPPPPRQGPPRRVHCPSALSSRASSFAPNPSPRYRWKIRCTHAASTGSTTSSPSTSTLEDPGLGGLRVKRDAGEHPAQDVVLLDDVRAQPPFSSAIEDVLTTDHLPAELRDRGVEPQPPPLVKLAALG